MVLVLLRRTQFFVAAEHLAKNPCATEAIRELVLKLLNPECNLKPKFHAGC